MVEMESEDSLAHSGITSRRVLPQEAEINELTTYLTKQANQLVGVALDSYRSSSRVLDITSRLRIAALNVFIKTERNTSGVNVFAPVSQEFMNLVAKYKESTSQFGSISTNLVELLVDYVKTIRKYRQFLLAICMVTISFAKPNKGKEKAVAKDAEIDQALQCFIDMRLHKFHKAPSLREHLQRYFGLYSKFRNTMSADLVVIARVYRKLQNIDRQLSNLSSIGEYAAHLAKIEASRLDGREDLVAAFDEIHGLLNASLAELQRMRSNFSGASHVIHALSFEGD